MTVTYRLDAPRPVDTPIRIRAHRGISSNPDTNEVAGVIQAGATSAVLAVQNNCGQVDVKAVFTGNGDARGRVSGPFIRTADNCSSSTATTPPPTVPPTSAGGGSTTPTSEGVTPCPICADTTSGSGSALSNQTLPETGSNAALLLILGTALVVGGVALVTKGRDRKPLPE
jgi:LPXTG-motif cell wall-anchored protein